MASRKVIESWKFFFITIFVLCLFFYKLYLLFFLYFYTATFTLPSDLLDSIYNSISSGDRLDKSIANLFRSMIFAFSAVAYTHKLSWKTGILLLILLVSIAANEFLVLQFHSEQIEKNLETSEIDITHFMLYLKDVEDSLVTYILVLLGLGGAKILKV